MDWAKRKIEAKVDRIDPALSPTLNFCGVPFNDHFVATNQTSNVFGNPLVRKLVLICVGWKAFRKQVEIKPTIELCIYPSCSMHNRDKIVPAVLDAPSQFGHAPAVLSPLVWPQVKPISVIKIWHLLIDTWYRINRSSPIIGMGTFTTIHWRFA